MTPEQEMARARRAASLMEDELVREALDTLRSATISKWEQAPTEKEREALWNFYRTIQLFEGYFRSMMETGKMASLQLEQEERKRKRWGVI